MGATTRTVLAIVTVMVGVSILAAAGSGAAAAQGPVDDIECGETIDEAAFPEDRDELLSVVRSMDDAPGLAEYSEFELVRSQAVLGIQAGEFGVRERQRTVQVLSLLASFERAYDCRQQGDYEASMDAANETAAIAGELSGDRGAQYSALADLGLSRFYEDLGGELLAVGEGQEATPDRIETFSMAAVAFREAGATERFSQLSLRLEELEAEYEADMERKEAAIERADEFVSDCEACTSPVAAISTQGVDVFDQYRAATSARDDVAEADRLLDEHNVEDEAVAEIGGQIDERTTALSIASALVLVGTSAGIGLVAAAISTRFVLWRRDLEAARVGEVVLLGRWFDDG